MNAVKQSTETQAQVTVKPLSGNKITTAKDTLALVATSIPVLGLLGSGVVWATGTYYVGDVNIATDRPFHNLTVKAFDIKGHESTFHTPRFQLMPGKYHLEITADDLSPRRADTVVSFNEQSTVAIELAEHSAAELVESVEATEKAKKRHWWQLWRH